MTNEESRRMCFGAGFSVPFVARLVSLRDTYLQSQTAPQRDPNELVPYTYFKSFKFHYHPKPQTSYFLPHSVDKQFDAALAAKSRRISSCADGQQTAIDIKSNLRPAAVSRA